MPWAPRTCPVAGQRRACQDCSPQVSHPAGCAWTTPRLCSQESGGLGRGCGAPCPGSSSPPAPSQGQGAISTGVSWEADVKSGTGPRLANRATRRAGAWGGRGAGQRRPGLHTRWPAAGLLWTEVGARRLVSTAAPGLNRLAPETDGHSRRPSHPPRQVRLEVLDGRGGRAREPDLPSQGGWGRAVVSSASQEGLRPDCTKAQGLDQLRADVTRFF